MRLISPRRCTYVVSIDPAATAHEVERLARSLSGLTAAGCEVLIIDFSDRSLFLERQRILRWILRWVGRHVNLAPVDLLRAAVDLASCEKIIIASPDTRCTEAEIESICHLLDIHEVVEPEEYVSPLPWWGGVEAGGLLLRRGVDQPPRIRSTFGFRRSAFRPLRGAEDDLRSPYLRRLVMLGAEVYGSREVFVRREPPKLATWFQERAREASADLALPFKAIFFFGLLPIVMFLALIGGLQLAGGYAGVVAFASVLLAVRGRFGASRFFPWHACLYAPMWIVARSSMIYWALFERMRNSTSVAACRRAPLIRPSATFSPRCRGGRRPIDA